MLHIVMAQSPPLIYSLALILSLTKSQS